MKWRWFLMMGLMMGLIGCDLFTRTPPPTPIDSATVPQTAVSIRGGNAPPPTPLAPLPTATPTAVPQPTPTYDPALAEWTLLIYLNADNNLEQAGILDLQEMVAAETNGRLHVLVQIDRAAGESTADGDWQTTRRYKISGQQTELLADLGETNMGDPAVLADFLTWGLQTYPANRTALILWDHGAGWNGIAFDNNAPPFDQPDHLTLPDLRTGIETALAATSLDKLDIIAFDACLMGQLDVFQTLHPLADFAVGSQELTPGQGWDYSLLLSALATDPQIDGEQLAKLMVETFIQGLSSPSGQPPPFASMTAVSLQHIPPLTTTLADLSQQLTAVSETVVSAVGDARSGAESFARPYADDAERYGAIDLHHFATLLAQRSPDTAVAAAARQLMAQVETAVLHHQAPTPNSRGIAIYFPRTAQLYDPTYAQNATLPGWDRFLTSYHAVGQRTLLPPDLRIINTPRAEASVGTPAFFEFEIVGRDIEQVSLFAALEESDNGRYRLLEYDWLIPEPTILADGSRLTEWQDGLHEDFYIWRTQATYLFDTQENGDFVVMWPTQYRSPLFTVQGLFTRASSGEQFPVNLLFDRGTGDLTSIWSYSTGSRDGIAELFAQPGDQFQPDRFFVGEAGELSREPGPALTFDELGKLAFDERPLPSGTYRFGFEAENVTGERSRDQVILTVNNASVPTGVQTYLDPYLSFQFAYPDSWFPPRYDGALLYTSDRQATAQFQITLFPDLPEGIDAAALQQQALAQFGGVDRLFTDEVMINGRSAIRTTYGYTDTNDLEHIGQFVTFVEGETGFVIDLDDLATAQTTTIETMASIVASWKTSPTGFDTQSGQWSTVSLADFSVGQPIGFVYQTFNGWQRFSDGVETFVALRTRATDGDVANRMDALLADASAGVNQFVAERPFTLTLGGHIWQRVDFAYTDDDGTPIWGYLMLRFENNQEVVAWVEAPANRYNQLENSIFLNMIADLDLAQRP